VSDNDIVLIPVDPHYVPSDSQREDARRILGAAVPLADHVTATVTEHPEVVHPHQNWSGVRCARCGATLDDDWWAAAVDEAATTEFRDLRTTLPCCGASESLNELDYVWPAGFARFQLEASNPNVGRLPVELIARLEAALGTKLRVIYQHI
jgi:hypothetical protein